MKYLKKFESFSIFEENWRDFLPDYLVLIEESITDSNGFLKDPSTSASTDQLCIYRLGNIMSDLVYQVTYERDFDFFGIPDTLEFDVALLNESELSIEITFGNLIACGFNIVSPNKVNVYEYTSFYSKTDPTNTVFAFDELSIFKILRFINRFKGFNLSRSDLNFLDNNPNNYRPS